MLQAVHQFLLAGGEVLYLICGITVLMWTLVFERLWYFHGSLKSQMQAVLSEWQARSDHHSWHAHQIRQLLLSQARMDVNQHLPMIQALVALAPLCGLLGTVWGMIEVFQVMAMTGGAEVKAMASGVSKATIPTMAGMVVALSGVFANTYLSRIANHKISQLEDSLLLEHRHA